MMVLLLCLVLAVPVLGLVETIEQLTFVEPTLP